MKEVVDNDVDNDSNHLYNAVKEAKTFTVKSLYF
jgi:hypothetical protein